MASTNGILLFRSILAAPEEDAPRLAFADWLDETGKPAAHAWGSFIRQQIAAHRAGVPDSAEVQALFATWWREWFGHLLESDPDGFMPSANEQYRHPAIIGYFPGIVASERWTANADRRLSSDWGPGPPQCTDYYCWWLVQRGFVSVVRAHWSHWLQFGATLCAAQPVTEVVLSTAPVNGNVNPYRWPCVRTWTTTPDDFRFWTKRPAWAQERP